MTYSSFTRRVETELRRHRRKQQLKAMAIILVMLALCTALYSLRVHMARSWLDKLDKVEASTVMSTTTVTIGPGDTLWHIAKDKYSDMGPREAVYEIRQLNPGVDPGGLQVGQKIVIPEVE